MNLTYSKDLSIVGAGLKIKVYHSYRKINRCADALTNMLPLVLFVILFSSGFGTLHFFL
jgi:hypothetical protein